jgi:hypothetical protein
MPNINEMVQQAIGDSLRRDDFAPKAETSKKPTKRRMMWSVLFGGKRQHSRLLTAPQAKKLAFRFNRLHKTDCAYADRFGYVRAE